MFTLKRALLVVFVIVAIEMGLTGAAYRRNYHTLNDYKNGQIRPDNVPRYASTGSYGDPARQTNSANNQSSNQLRSLILSAVMIIIIILSRILACFENKNCQRAAVILNYLSTGVLVVMLYFIYNDIILSVH
eukprot:182274_1